MELKIISPSQAQPLPPVEWNYPEIKQWVSDGLAKYQGIVYDESQMPIAKRDRANLNKLAETIDAKRREMKALYLQPYMDFEAQAKELTAMIKEVSDAIADQVKASDERRKQEKLEKIKADLYAPMIDGLGELVPYERLHDPRWLNVTCSVNTIGTELAKKIENIVAGLDAIDKMGLSAEMTARVKSVFLRNFDLAAAISEKERIEKEQANLARYQAAREAQRAAEAEMPTTPKYTPPEPAKPTAERPAADTVQSAVHTEAPIQLDFRVWVNREQMAALRDFLQTNNIKYGRVPKAKESEE